MILKELIEFLQEWNRNIIVPLGFNNPHSYRGYYDELAFEPVENTTVGEMLDCAKEALGNTYTGWKGGDFKMGPCTEVYLSIRGEYGGETIGIHLLNYMVGNYIVSEVEDGSDIRNNKPTSFSI